MRRCLVISFLLLLTFNLNAQKRIDNGYVETYIQYVPIVADLGLGLIGAEADHCFMDRGVEAAIGAVTVTAITNVLKYTVKEERPDGRSCNSFPSGHTATAFFGAELVRREYGWGCGAGAYAVAASVGVMRVYHQRHWWWDACAGAAAGVFSAWVGSVLMEPVKDWLGLEFGGKLALASSIDPMSGTLCAGLSISLQ